MFARTALLALTLLSACEHSGGQTPATAEPPETPEAAHTVADSPPAPAAAPAPRLAESPRIDLVANRYRWHLGRPGLVIPFASEGLHKYAHEYSRPFGPVVEHDGKPGRVLKSSSALLRFPVFGSAKPTTLRLWAHGLSGGQKVTVDLNGKSLGKADLPDSWSMIELAIPDGALRPGENELRLRPSAAGKAGGQTSRALWYAIELADGSSPKDWPALDAATGDALGGFGSLALYQEIPQNAWLTLRTSAPTTIEAVRANGKVTKLLGSDAAPGDQRISLRQLQGELVRLDVRSTGTLQKPQIALEEAPLREAPRFENAILLVVDALRADRLALYGKTRVQTPRFTEAGKHATVFQYNQSASPSSPPSHASIQTGMIPRVHGVTGDTGKPGDGVKLISTHLGAAGIATGYIGNNEFGMGRLKKVGAWTYYNSPIMAGKGQDCVPVIEGALKFAETQHEAGKRFFVSALPIEPHAPYRHHPDITDRYHQGEWKKPLGKRVTGHDLEAIAAGRTKMDDGQWSQIRALYDGEVEHMDQCFGQLLDGLAALGVADNTAIILTADHGEGMGERSRMGHAYGHFAELANVPFVVFAPNQPARAIPTVTGHLDIAPTVLDLLGVKPSDAMQGDSMVPLMRRDGPWVPRVVGMEYGKSYALRAEHYKLAVDYAGKESLFDERADPTHQRDASADQPMALRYMRDLVGFYLEHRADWRTSTWGTLNNHARGAFGGK